MVFFIGANTPDGFIDYGKTAFDGIEHIYIIKGAPGTGKSRFMKSAKEYFEKRGLMSISYRCSSDDTSLDGLVIPGAGIAFTDGTSPHAREAVLPGVREEIIDVGRFWNREQLCASKEKICELMKRKSEAFERAYVFLRAYSCICSEKKKQLKDTVNIEKIHKVVKRELGGAEGEEYSCLPYQTICLGMNGRVRFDTLEGLAKNVVYIEDRRGLGGEICDAFIKEAENRKLRIFVSRDPAKGMEAAELYFPSIGTSVISGLKSDMIPEGARRLNTERFLVKEKYNSKRRYIRELDHTLSDIYSYITDSFAEVRENHFALEKIYSATMDFDALSRYRSELFASVGASLNLE